MHRQPARLEEEDQKRARKILLDVQEKTDKHLDEVSFDFAQTESTSLHVSTEMSLQVRLYLHCKATDLSSGNHSSENV